jgi:phosphatidylserine decarboxylase
VQPRYAPMTLRAALETVFRHEDLNFLLTNRIPRRFATRFMGWFSRIEQPLVRDLSLAVWQRCADLRLHEAERSDFRSVHDCFTRRLKPGARTVDADPAVLTSPCDAIVGAWGEVREGMAVQAKGFPYALGELLGREEAERYEDGVFVTLRLTASMYHRFHAPYDLRVEHVTYFSGDTWNVNPIALARIERLFCRNERAALRLRLATGEHVVTVVAVAAILVAGIRLRFLDVPACVRYGGRNDFDVEAAFRKGEELGWFEHGSTLLVFAPRGFRLHHHVATGAAIRMGQPLLRWP